MQSLLTRLKEQSPGTFAGESKDWNRIIVKHATAWFILFLLAVGIFRMAGNTLHSADASSQSTETATSLTLPSGEGRLQIIANSLSVHKEQAANSEKIGLLTKGSVVQLLEAKDDWIKVRTTDNIVGYIGASSDNMRPAP